MPTVKQTPTFPFLRVADLSTSHLRPSDIDIINDAAAVGVSLSGEQGALVYLPEPSELGARTDAGYSPAFVELLRIALAQGFTHIRFDAAGTVVAGLPTFES